MANKNFKEIVDNKGYKITIADRKIFERNLGKSLFGLDSTLKNHTNSADVIEFVLFDSNDNQLPQGDSGALVRYIYLDDAKIGEYITISLVTDNKTVGDTNEYSINADTLIKEAGYSNGIFKVQVTLLNRRIGTDVDGHDKVWIHEISPSRTEIRVLPVKDNDNVVNQDLQTRYDVFLRDGEFRDDTIHYVQSFIEQIKLDEVLINILTSKGRVENGKSYISLIKNEFKIYDFDSFLNDVKLKYTEAMIHFMENRNYDVTSINYGNPIPSVPTVSLSVNEIKNKAIEILTNIIDSILPKRNIIKDSIITEEKQVTLDELDKILKTTTSDEIFDTETPLVKLANASVDPIRRPPPPMQTKTTTYYVWSKRGIINYTDKFGKPLTKKGKENTEFTITYSGEPTFIGDIRTIKKPNDLIITKKPKKHTTVSSGGHKRTHHNIDEYMSGETEGERRSRDVEFLQEQL